MHKQIFISLPVEDLEKSKKYFTSLGYTFNPQFTDEKAGCLVITEDRIYAMLLTKEYYRTFTAKELADTSKYVESIIALSCESKEQVDYYIEKALKAGAKEPSKVEDYGFMYARNVEDLDGHTWRYIWMAVTKLKN